MSYIYPCTSCETMKYKIYFVYDGSKIYLGTSSSYEEAEKILEEAESLMKEPDGIPDFSCYHLNYKKIISLCNLRDNKKYIKNPIYIYPNYFHYYLTSSCILVFDLKDLFYFSSYKIYKRGNYLYTQDHVSQQNILARFGILNHSVAGRDYFFKNGNCYDFRQDNIQIVNSYKGVVQKHHKHSTTYIASIYIDKKLVIGHYPSELEAAIAYNKAIDILIDQGVNKPFVYNSIPLITKDEYNMIYDRLSISPRILHREHQRKRIVSQKKYRGITKGGSSYRVHIGYNNKQYYLGMYPTEKRAAQAYNYASLYLFGRQGYINEVTPLIDEKDASKIVTFFDKYNLLK